MPEPKSSMLTHARLVEVLDYDPTTGIFTWKERPGNRRWNTKNAGCVAGSVYFNGYSVISIDKVRNYAHRLAWFFVHQVWPRAITDHIDRTRTANRIDNLRPATASENALNRPAPRQNTSGIKGVWFDRRRNKWVAEVCINNRKHYIGQFADLQAAAEARRGALARLAGEFAHPD